MKITGELSLKGTGFIYHYRNGELLSKQTFTNTVTNMGLDQVAGLINGQRPSAFDSLQLGTSGTAAAVGDIALLAPITAGSLAGAGATCTQLTTDTTNDSAYFVHSWSATGSYTVKEIAIGTSTAAPRILSRTTNFVAVGLTNGDSLTVYYKIDVD